jgi:hypothetical protein
MQNYIDPATYGALGDDAHNDGPAIQQALTAAAAGAQPTTVQLRPGIYRVSQSLTFMGDHTALTSDGKAVIKAITLLDRILDSNNFDGIRIEGISVLGFGVHSVQNAGRGAIHLDTGSNQCEVIQCIVDNAPGTGIVDDGNDNLVAFCKVGPTAEHGIYASGAQRSRYIGNRLEGVGTVPSSPFTAHAISLATARYCVVSSNMIFTTTGAGIALRDASQFNSIVGNTLNAISDRYIIVGTGYDNTITGNVLRGMATNKDGIHINGGGRTAIVGNVFYRGSAGGAAIRWATATPFGGDVCTANSIIFDGVANSPAIDLNASAAANVLVHGNSIQVEGGAPVPVAIRVVSGTNHRIYDNVVVPASLPALAITPGIQALVRSGAHNRGASLIADGATITHGLPMTPTRVSVSASVAGQMASVIAVGATTFTVAIKTHTGAAGTTQTIYWEAEG